MVGVRCLSVQDLECGALGPVRPRRIGRREGPRFGWASVGEARTGGLEVLT